MDDEKYVFDLWKAAASLRVAGEIDEAKALLMDTYVRCPDHFLPAEGLARIAETEAAWVEAEVWWRKSKALNEAHWQSHIGLACALREQGKSSEAGELLVGVLDRVGNLPGGLAAVVEQITSPHGQMPAHHLEKLERLVAVQCDLPEPTTRILLAAASLARERQDWFGYQRRLQVAHQRYPADLRTRTLLIQADELVLAHEGGRPSSLSAVDPASSMAASELLVSFESLGGGRGLRPNRGGSGGCEFGFFQREFGAEPLSLLRWATIELSDLCRALDEDFAGLTDGNSIELHTQSAYDWRLRENIYNIQIDHTHLDRSKVDIGKALKMVRTRFAFLRRKMLDDLAAGEKIFVYRVADDKVSAEQIQKLARAINRFGNNRLLFVMHSEDMPAEHTVEQVKGGLWTAKLKPYDGRVNLDAWLALCRSVHSTRCTGLPAA